MRSRAVERFPLSPSRTTAWQPVAGEAATAAPPGSRRHPGRTRFARAIVRPPRTVTADLPLVWPLVDANVTSTQGGGELAEREWVRDPPLPIEKLLRPEWKEAGRFLGMAEPQEVLETPGVGEIEEVLGAPFGVPHHDSQHPRERQRALGVQTRRATPAPQRAARGAHPARPVGNGPRILGRFDDRDHYADPSPDGMGNRCVSWSR